VDAHPGKWGKSGKTGTMGILRSCAPSGGLGEGYSDIHNTWEPEANLTEDTLTEEALCAYKEYHGLTHPNSLLNE